LAETGKRGTQRLIVVIGVLISVVFLALAFRGLHPQDFVASLGTVQPAPVALAAVIYFGAVALISWRWQFLLTPVRAVRLPRLIQLVSIGYMGNNIYPLRAGEALRIYLLHRDEQVPIFRSTTITLVERIFDGIVMLSFILIGVSASSVQNEAISAVVRVATPVFAAGLAAFVAAALAPQLARRVRDWCIRPLPVRLRALIVHLSDEVLHGLGGLQNPLQLGGAVIGSYMSWGVEALVYWIVMQAFSFDLPYSAALLVVGTVNLAGLIPASPGQIGVYEYFASAVLMSFGIAQERALSYAIVVHIVIWLPVTLLGFFFLVRRGLGLRALARAHEMETASSSA
jgi:hypothetical protein